MPAPETSGHDFSRDIIIAMTDPELTKLPIDGTLDLHTFLPGEIRDLVPEYLAICRERGITHVRIIHGKGVGTLKRIVESVLSELAYVDSFRTADENAGGWGATIVTLRKNDNPI